MPKGSPELTQARHDEIVNACAKLYETMGFKEITIKEIANFTSFTRPSIYNYFQTKEEIFLALFKQEYEMWTKEIDELEPSGAGDARLEFSSQIAHTLERRERLLKLLSTNMNEMELNSRPENLVAFKTAYGASVDAVGNCLQRFCPDMPEQDREDFVFSFFPLVYGIYPYAVVSDEQKEAMEKAGVHFRYMSIYEIACLGARKLWGYKNMKIVVLEGSPHKKGSSNMLAGEFIKGAHEAGHTIEALDVAHMDIHPCLGCEHCGMNGVCVYKDDNHVIRDALLATDMAVFVTPIYYFGMSAQLKMVIDRFYSYTTKLSGKSLKTVLITAAWDADDDVMPYTAEHYKKLCRYMNFKDCGMVLGTGCGSPSVTAGSNHMEEAYRLGKSL